MTHKGKGTQTVAAGVVVMLIIIALLLAVPLANAGSGDMSRQAMRDGTPTPDPTVQAAQEFDGGNDDWEPVIREFDGVEMVLVPAGCFEMGSVMGTEDEQPVHQQCFDEPFWIDRYEVTNAQYHMLDSDWQNDDLPRVEVTWYEAWDFCELREGRLPTEAEWEYAARGPDALIYPWGDQFESDYVVYGENSDMHTAEVGSRPEGASWVGTLDMSGNAWEWVADWYDPAYYAFVKADTNPTGPESGEFRVLRGGSWWHFDSSDLRGANRDSSLPDLSLDSFGFRCARSYE